MAADLSQLTRRAAMAWGAAAVVASTTGCGKGSSTSTRRPASPRPSASEPSGGPADLVVRGGVILTGEAAQPSVEALAARRGVIVALGSQADVAPWIDSSAAVVDLAGGAATAGLTDAHAHVAAQGRSLEQVDLRHTRSIDEIIRRLREHPTSNREWIEGTGWDQNDWPTTQMPTHQPLTEAFPDRPVWLHRIDGHAGWANRALLRAAGIDRHTESPPGGEILRDEAGEPTGVLVDAAMQLVVAPAATLADLKRWILAGQTHFAERGLTGVHDMGVSAEADAIYRELATTADPAQRLALRIHGYANEDWFRSQLRFRGPDEATPDSTYVLAGVKLYADGALGSRGAALLEPYADRPTHRGLLAHSQSALDEACDAVLAAGWQPAAHAIGDAAVRAVLDAYERSQRAHPRPDHRARIEHSQIVALEDIARFAGLGTIASMQPTHATSDMPWVDERLGAARLERAYAWRRFLDAGAKLCFGSDGPIEQADVAHGLHAAVTRQDATGHPPGGWLPDQRLTLAEAIRAFSSRAAFAAHREAHLGRLIVGFQADLTCFAQNIAEVAPSSLRAATIAATIVAGRVVFRS